MISQSLQRRIKHIVEKSLCLPTARHKHFSFIVKTNKICCWGYNQSFKSHPTAARFGHRFNSIHSELNAITNFPYPPEYLRDYSLVNVRVNPSGSCMMLAKPCPKCIYFLSCFNLRQVIYSNEYGQFVEL